MEWERKDEQRKTDRRGCENDVPRKTDPQGCEDSHDIFGSDPLAFRSCFQKYVTIL